MKNKALNITLVVVVVLTAIFFGARALVGPGAYDAFKVAMDRAVGQGNWSDQGHSVSLFSRALVVKNLEVKAFSGKEPVTCQEVEIKSSLTAESLNKLLGLSDWRGQEAADLADRVSFKKAQWKPDASTVIEMGDLTLENLKMRKADDQTPLGATGFAKAAELGRLTISELTMSPTDPAALALGDTMRIGRLEIIEPSFSGEPDQEFQGLLGPDNEIVMLLSTLTVKEASAKDIKGSMAEDEGTFEFSIGSSAKKNVTSFAKVGRVETAGWRLAFTSKNDPAKNMEFTLGKAEANNLDLMPYLKKVVPMIYIGQFDPQGAAAMASSAQTLADMFVLPFSLDDMRLSDVGFSFASGQLGFKMADCSVAGPFKAGEIPARQTSRIKGLEIFLPTDLKIAEEADVKELHDFAKDFGMSRFVIDGEGVASYDEAKGVLVNTTDSFVIKDLAELTGRIEFGGLTRERLAVFQETPMDSILLVLMSPRMVLGDFSLNGLNLKYKDNSLTDRVCAYVGKTRLDGLETGQVKKLAAASFKAWLDDAGAEFLAEPQVVGAPVAAFLENPGAFEIDLKPRPPFSFESVDAMKNPEEALNSLNLTVTANGGRPVPVKFALPELSGAPVMDDQNWDDEDHDDESGRKSRTDQE